MSPLAGRARALIRRQPYHLLLPFTSVWLIKPYYQGTRLDWVALAIAWPLFLALYALAHSQPQSQSRSVSTAALAGLGALGAAYVPLNPEASGIFAFVAAILAARHLPLPVLSRYWLAINLLLLAEVLVFHLNLWTWLGGGSGAILFSLSVLLHVRERETNFQLRLAQDQVARLARLGERERITRDLHDVLGHTLSLIAIKSELAQKRFHADPAATLAEAQQIESIARQALVRVREAIHGYASPSFSGEVDRIAAALRSVGIKVQCDICEVPMTPMHESVFAMILEEAVTNILRHAHAGCCRIQLLSVGAAVQLLVEDDGRGSPDYEGFGLRGMRERLRLLGGSLQVQANHGTQLQASLPLEPPGMAKVISVC